MGIAVTDLIGKAIQPVANLIDGMSTSGEERGKLRLALSEAQHGLIQEVLGYESKLVDAQASVILAEAQSQSWMARNWRPLLMLAFGGIVVWNYAGVTLLEWLMAMFAPTLAAPPRLELTAGVWTVLTTGIGGYIGGRSAEKIAKTLTAPVLDFGKGAGGNGPLSRKEVKRIKKLAALGLDRDGNPLGGS